RWPRAAGRPSMRGVAMRDPCCRAWPVGRSARRLRRPVLQVGCDRRLGLARLGRWGARAGELRHGVEEDAFVGPQGVDAEGLDLREQPFDLAAVDLVDTAEVDAVPAV